jgi:broad specificity phosphatase PhoE
LSEAGRKALKKTAAFLKDKNVAEVYSSDLRRGIETANVLKDVLTPDEDIEQRYNLRPMNVGTLAGLKKDETESAMSDLLSRKWKQAPGGESYADFLSRFQQGLRDAMNDGFEKYPKSCVYVTHSHNMGALAHLLSEESEPYQMHSPVGNGGVLELRVEQGGKRTKLRIALEPNGKVGA